MKKHRLLLNGLVLLSSLLCALASPNPLTNEGFPSLGFIALVPFVMALYKTERLRSMLCLSFLFGFSFSLLSNFWLYFFQGFKWLTLGGGALGVGFTMMLIPLLVYFIKDYPPAGRALLFAVSWALFEYTRTQGYLGFPWGMIAYSTHNFPLFNQIIDTTGLSFLSFLFALINALVAEALLLQGKSLQALRKPFYILISFACITLIYGLFRYYQPFSVDKQVKITLVQQNNDSWIGGSDSSMMAHIDVIEENLSAVADSNLIVSGEGILNNYYYSSYYPAEENIYFPFSDFIAKLGIYQLIGAPVRGDWGVQNGTILVNPQGDIVDDYGKRQLVPMAEGLPFINHQFMQNFLLRHDFYTGYEPGKKATIYNLPLPRNQSVKFSTPICFEDAFPWLNRQATLLGSEIFVNPTNDSWSKTVSAEMQHFVAAKFRTIENRRVLVRAANSGITAVVDIKGRVLAQVKPFTTTVLPVTIDIHSSTLTFYSRFGDWLILIFILIHAGAFYCRRFRWNSIVLKTFLY